MEEQRDAPTKEQGRNTQVTVPVGKPSAKGTVCMEEKGAKTGLGGLFGSKIKDRQTKDVKKKLELRPDNLDTYGHVRGNIGYQVQKRSRVMKNKPPPGTIIRTIQCKLVFQISLGFWSTVRITSK